MQYFLYGLRVLASTGYRKFILIPLAANAILFVIMAISLFSLLPSSVQWLMEWVPSWIPFVDFLLYSIFGLLFLLAYLMSFTMITNIFAAPFNGLLAEKIQREAGLDVPEESISSIVVRTLGREIQKLIYFVVYGIAVAIGLFVLSLIPLVNLLVPVLAFLWTAWCLSVQYLDYAADNNKQDFRDLRTAAKKPWFSTFGFGSLVSLVMLIPVVNIFVMPAAVAGGTLLWLRKIHQPVVQFELGDIFIESKGSETHKLTQNNQTSD